MSFKRLGFFSRLLDDAAPAERYRMALEQIDRPRDDPWWFHIMEQPIRMWSDGGAQLDCLKLLLARCDPNILGRTGDGFNNAWRLVKP